MNIQFNVIPGKSRAQYGTSKFVCIWRVGKPRAIAGVVALALFTLAAPSWAEAARQADPEVHSKAGTARPAGGIQSTQEADQALADAARRRAEIERTFLVEQTACSQRFFVSSCMEKAEEKRRLGLKPLRAIEAEANVFKRRHRAEQRDKALEKRSGRSRGEPDVAQREEAWAQSSGRSSVFEEDDLTSPSGLSDKVRDVKPGAGNASPIFSRRIGTAVSAGGKPVSARSMHEESDASAYVRDLQEMDRAERSEVRSRLAVP